MSDLTDEVCLLIEQATEHERLIILAHLRERVPRHLLETEWGTTAEEIIDGDSAFFGSPRFAESVESLLRQSSRKGCCRHLRETDGKP